MALPPSRPTPIDCPGLTVMIDNFDSFTYNIVQYLQELGATVRVFRNDAITLAALEALAPARIVLSPGPGAPCDAGITSDVLRAWAGRVPILGVCLGLQCMYEAFGGTVTHAGEIVHGKTSPIEHDGRGVFAGLPSPFRAVRYHSLAGTPATLPRDLRVTARTANGIIQGVRHATYAMEGVQFHPESILTEHGHAMFRNFLGWQGGLWPEAAEAAAAAAATAGPAPQLPLAIVSVLPAATSIVYALGLQGALRGVSHECYFPAPARRLPRILRAAIDSEALSSAEIDAAVKAASASGSALYALDEEALGHIARGSGRLVVLTQALCDVCAAGPRVVGEALARLPPCPRRAVVDCSAASLRAMLGDVAAVARACGVEEVGRGVVAGLQARIDACAARVAAALGAGAPRPRVACVEWLSPLYNSVRVCVGGGRLPGTLQWCVRACLTTPHLSMSHTLHFTPPRARRGTGCQSW
jgi:anthranilate synthase/aminodeoxychorismate synthase-like glutamine amidotransferase